MFIHAAKICVSIIQSIDRLLMNPSMDCSIDCQFVGSLFSFLIFRVPINPSTFPLGVLAMLANTLFALITYSYFQHSTCCTHNLDYHCSAVWCQVVLGAYVQLGSCAAARQT